LRRIFPEPAGEVDDAELEALYDYPGNLAAPWIQLNFVSSADGASTVDGQSDGLSSPADKKIFALARSLADVILVGAGTVLAEGYRGVKPTEVRASRRSRLGRSELPPIAAVTRRCSIDPASPLLTDTVVPPIIITCAAAPEDRRTALSDAGADLVVAGDTTVDLARAINALADRGLFRVNCEGGPQLAGELIAVDLVDQLCLTIAPLLTAGDATRIAHGPLPQGPMRRELESVLTDNGYLMLRYRRAGD
jgi:riboflavin biosynthesis pyrimidine reductase